MVGSVITVIQIITSGIKEQSAGTGQALDDQVSVALKWPNDSRVIWFLWPSERI